MWSLDMEEFVLVIGDMCEERIEST
jgi:hypothetical protein